MHTKRIERLILIALVALGLCAAVVLPLAAGGRNTRAAEPAQAQEAPRAPNAVVQADPPARAE